MDVTLSIPDDIAEQLAKNGGDLGRRALENFALEELRAGRITEVQLRRMLGLDRMDVDEFLKAHGIFYEFTVEEIDQQVKTLERLGF